MQMGRWRPREGTGGGACVCVCGGGGNYVASTLITRACWPSWGIALASIGSSTTVPCRAVACLQLIAAHGRHDQQHAVRQIRHRSLALTDADRLDEHTVVAGGLTHD